VLDSLDRYIRHISSVRRYSPRTVEIYRSVLDGYFARSGDSLTPDAIRNYEVWLLDECGEDPRTVNQHMSVLSGYCRYLVREGRLKSNPVKLIPRPKMPRRLPSFYRASSMEEYLSSTETFVRESDLGMPERYERRLRRLMVSMLYSTGMRRSELVSLRRDSVDFGRRVVRVRGKGDKMREIPMIPELCDEISLYLQSVDTMVGCEMTGDSPLLVTIKGKAVYPVLVDRAVKTELGAVSSITGKKSPHVLRHTLATELLDDGADINSIKALLGHSSLAATQVYTHNSIEKLRTVYNNAHPRAKNGGKNGN